VVAWGSGGTTFEYWIFYGTSAGSPQWAAIIAIADQSAAHDLGNVNSALYAIGHSAKYASDFRDTTVGNNRFASISGYSAIAGWDAASCTAQ